MTFLGVPVHEPLSNVDQLTGIDLFGDAHYCVLTGKAAQDIKAITETVYITKTTSVMDRALEALLFAAPIEPPVASKPLCLSMYGATSATAMSTPSTSSLIAKGSPTERALIISKILSGRQISRSRAYPAAWSIFSECRKSTRTVAGVESANVKPSARSVSLISFKGRRGFSISSSFVRDTADGFFSGLACTGAGSVGSWIAAGASTTGVSTGDSPAPQLL
jgi:hypothetical protein